MYTTNQEKPPAQDSSEQSIPVDSGDVIIPRSSVVPRILFLAVATILLGGTLLVVGFFAGYQYQKQENDSWEYSISDTQSNDPANKMMQAEVTPLALEAGDLEYEQVVADDAQFQSDALEFVLYLPTEFSSLVMLVHPDTGSGGTQAVSFDLPVKNAAFDSQTLFSIAQYEPGFELDEENMPAVFLAEDTLGRRYYFFPSLDMGIAEDMPEYATVMKMLEYDLLEVVSNGFRVFHQ